MLFYVFVFHGALNPLYIVHNILSLNISSSDIMSM